MLIYILSFLCITYVLIEKAIVKEPDITQCSNDLALGSRAAGRDSRLTLCMQAERSELYSQRGGCWLLIHMPNSRHL